MPKNDVMSASSRARLYCPRWLNHKWKIHANTPLFKRVGFNTYTAAKYQGAMELLAWLSWVKKGTNVKKTIKKVKCGSTLQINSEFNGTTANLKTTSSTQLRLHKKFKNQLVNTDETTQGIKGWELKTIISEVNGSTGRPTKAVDLTKRQL